MRRRGRRGVSRPVAWLVAGVLAALTATTPAAHAAPAGADSPGPDDLGAVADRIVPGQLADGDIPGAVVTVVAGGRTVFSQAYGVADPGAGTPMDAATTAFYTGSLAKLFTATATLQLVRAGKLDLHTDVNAYLQRFSVPDTYPGRPVTVHGLLTYTSGFDNDIYGWSQWDRDRMPSLSDFAADALPSRVRPPGELVAYNNYDYVLLGHLIETVSGRAYADYVAEHVFAPLGMRSTTATQPPPSSLESRVTTGHRPHGGSQAPTGGQHSPAVSAGPDVVTDSADMARFMIAQLRGDPALGPDVTDLMQDRQFTVDPRVPGMGYAFEQRPRDGIPVVFKDGDSPGVHNHMALVPGSGLGIHVVYNGDGTEQAAFWGGKALIDRLIDEFHPGGAAGQGHLHGDVSRYAGEYEDARTSQSNFTRVGSLMSPVTVEAAGDGRLTTDGLSENPSVSTQNWVQTGPGLFRLDGGSATLAFDGSGTLVSSQTPSASYVRLGWFRSPALHLVVLGVAVSVLLVGFVLLPIRSVARRRRPVAERSAGPRVAVGLAWTTALGAMLFGAAFVMVSADANRLMEIPLTGDPVLSVALNTVSVTGVLAVAVLVAAVAAWWRRWWTPARRVAYSAFALAAVAFVVIAVAYRLVGLPLTLTV